MSKQKKEEHVCTCGDGTVGHTTPEQCAENQFQTHKYLLRRNMANLSGAMHHIPNNKNMPLVSDWWRKNMMRKK